MRHQGWELFERGIPLGVILTIRPCRHNADLDNIYKSVTDAAQGIVYEDDRWIDHICCGRSGKENDDAAYFTVFVLAEQL